MSPIGGAASFRWQGEYGAMGRLQSEAYDDVASGESWSNSFTYDGFGRLVGESHGRSGTAYDYQLDAGGNRLLTRVDTDTGSGWVPSMTAGYSGQRLDGVDGKALAYDPWQGVLGDQRGNVFTRSPGGRVRTATGAGGSITISRDANGIPVRTRDKAGDRLTVWGLNPGALPLEVVAANGDVLTYLQADGLDLGRLLNGRLIETVANTRGSLARHGTQALDHATAFGDGARPPSGSDERFLYAGLERLPQLDGVHLARHRAYDPQTGRFLSPDPIGLLGGPHRFQYADGDPVQLRDPMGWAACDAGTSNLPNLPMLEPIGGRDTMGLGWEPSELSRMMARLGRKRGGYAAAIAEALSGGVGGGSTGPFNPDPCQTIGCEPVGGGPLSAANNDVDPADSSDSDPEEPSDDAPDTDPEYHEITVWGERDAPGGPETEGETSEEEEASEEESGRRRRIRINLGGGGGGALDDGGPLSGPEGGGETADEGAGAVVVHQAGRQRREIQIRPPSPSSSPSAAPTAPVNDPSPGETGAGRPQSSGSGIRVTQARDGRSRDAPRSEDGGSRERTRLGGGGGSRSSGPRYSTSVSRGRGSANVSIDSGGRIEAESVSVQLPKGASFTATGDTVKLAIPGADVEYNHQTGETDAHVNLQDFNNGPAAAVVNSNIEQATAAMEVVGATSESFDATESSAWEAQVAAEQLQETVGRSIYVVPGLETAETYIVPTSGFQWMHHTVMSPIGDWLASQEGLMPR